MVGGGGWRLAGSRRRCARLAAFGYRPRRAVVLSALGQNPGVILTEPFVAVAPL